MSYRGFVGYVQGFGDARRKALMQLRQILILDDFSATGVRHRHTATPRNEHRTYPTTLAHLLLLTRACIERLSTGVAHLHLILAALP